MKRVLNLAWVSLALLVSFGCATGPPPSPLALGEVAIAAGDWRTAKTHFAEAVRIEPRSGRAWHGQARAQLAGRDAEGALRSLTNLSKVDRSMFSNEASATYADSLATATDQRLQRDKSAAALVAARALSKLEPTRRDLDRLLGRALVAEAARFRWSGDKLSALSLYREACGLTPNAIDAWVGAAEILLELGRGKEAMKHLELARKSHPTAGLIRTLTIQALGVR